MISPVFRGATRRRAPLRPLLVATDLDGTIIRDDGTISARTVAAFARVEAAGARFVLVTGRPPRWMRSTRLRAKTTSV